MDFLLTETSNHPWQCCAHDLLPGQERVLPSGGNGVSLSLEQVAPLLRGIEIQVLEAQRIYHRSDLRQLTIQYPCHLRVPVRGGMGITASNRIDAIAACQTLFSRKVNGAFPEYLLLEADYSLEQHLSLAMLFDLQSNKPTIWGRRAQTVGTSSLPEDGVDIEKIYLKGDFEAEDGLILASRLGLGNQEGQGLADLLEKLYILMTWAELTSCCLDSLALGSTGEITVLAGEVTFSSNSPLKHHAQAAMQTGAVIHPALLSYAQLAQGAESKNLAPRNAEIPNIVLTTHSAPARPPQNRPSPSPENRFAPPRLVRLGEGNIAVISNGFRRTMNTLEQFQLQGSSVAAFVNLQGGRGIAAQASAPEIHYDSSLPRIAWTDRTLFCDTAPTEAGLESARDDRPIHRDKESELDAFSLKRQLNQALQALERLREVKVILINWRSSQLPCRILADALVEYQGQLTQQARRSAQPMALVVRLAGTGAVGGYQHLMGEEIETEVTLEKAIARSIGLARMGRGS